ncbi:hypothetical protein CNR27_11265 [Luteimonas chenhongjianii]|uniref:DUF2065 domain-containing protein n=1 Tax=Luteimonas chenhongjianii TaxID=2006110 RepID=A0A290XFY9_9GAMM|nr:DUF2065 family protein [Luteimonas chenhongjianii]ATD67938.1 hypothetical protein CNR27_11265 [Luteimonas chenhongjianii]
MSDLWAALCLVFVVEGLMLFAAPGFWKRNAEQMLALPLSTLRRIGAAVLALGLVALYFVRG